MQHDIYVRILLSLIALTLLGSLLRASFVPVPPERDRQVVTPVRAAPTETNVQTIPRWEYKTIGRRRTFAVDVKSPSSFGFVASWDQWSEDGEFLSGSVDMRKKLHELGEQGWELVSVEPQSESAKQQVLFGKTSACFGEGIYLKCDWETYSTGYAANGVTTADAWVFKRPLR